MIVNLSTMEASPAAGTPCRLPGIQPCPVRPFLYTRRLDFCMLVSVESNLRETKIPEISETEEDKCKQLKDLREFYIKFARTHFQGRKYRNKAMNEDILVSRDGIDKLEGMISFREQCIAIQLLDKILINSVVEKYEPDKKNRWNVEGFIYLVYQCRLNDKPYKIYTTIKKTVNNPLKFYGYILIDIKIEATRR